MAAITQPFTITGTPEELRPFNRTSPSGEDLSAVITGVVNRAIAALYLSDEQFRGANSLSEWLFRIRDLAKNNTVVAGQIAYHITANEETKRCCADILVKIDDPLFEDQKFIIFNNDFDSAKKIVDLSPEKETLYSSLATAFASVGHFNSALKCVQQMKKVDVKLIWSLMDTCEKHGATTEIEQLQALLTPSV